MEQTSLVWRKSSYSGVHGNCVEVAAPRKQCPGIGDRAFLVRDSQDPAGPVLEAGAGAWRAFLAGIKGS
jgi:hypothetical protein